jgi:hypothetical protein
MRPFVLTLTLFCSLTAATPDPLYRALRTSELTESFTVENLVLKRDAGVFTLKNGTIGFTAPAQGRDTIAVFIGDGEFAFDPPLGVEKAHLKQVIDQDNVREAFDRAIFVFTDNTGKELRGTAKSRPADSKLADTLKDFRKRIRKSDYDTENLDAVLLTDLYNPKQEGFFSAYIHGRKHSDLQFHVKPRSAIPGLPSPEEVALVNAEPGSEQGGIWYLSHRLSEFTAGTASSQEENRIVQADSYNIQTTIAKNDRFTAIAEIALQAVTDGDRVIAFDLLPTLRVTKVSAGGQEIPFIQEDRKEDADFYVVLPQPMARGSKVQLTIEYAGDKVLRKEGGGNFSVGARESWYPSLNSFRDHSRYHLTFKAPKRYTMVSVGKMVREWTEGDMACSEWDSEVPVAVAGFNLGEFKKKTISDDSIKFSLEGYAVGEMPDMFRQLDVSGMSPSRLNEGNLIDAQNAMRLFTQWFGKSEFSRLAITQQPEMSFGQSWPTLIYLPVIAYLDSTQRFQIFGMSRGIAEFVDEVTAHEVSHQWWGHMVTWSSYHDVWLSEGFAFFSAGLFLQHTQKTPQKYLDYWDHARKRLTEKNAFGRRLNDAGPVWMGPRVDTFKNPASTAIVYDKGGYVLHMLRSLMWTSKDGDKPFQAMMQEFVKEYMNRNASTEAFKAIAEKHMNQQMDIEGNHKLDWFFREWVYGTAIPKYKFEPEVTAAADGKWLLKASLTQSEVEPGFAMLVPLYGDFDGQIIRLGAVRMVGNSTIDTLQVLLPKKPKRIMINYNHDILEM